MKKFFIEHIEGIMGVLFIAVALGIPSYKAFKQGEILIGVLLIVAIILISIISYKVINA